jgi:hypothetical protein
LICYLFHRKYWEIYTTDTPHPTNMMRCKKCGRTWLWR